MHPLYAPRSLLALAAWSLALLWSHAVRRRVPRLVLLLRCHC
jgi:hypothetical protein